MGLDAGYGIGSLKPGVCTSSTRPASPYEGQTIYETDTDVLSIWNGSAWKTVSSTKGATFDSTGRMTNPVQPCFFVSNEAGSTASSGNKITFNTESLDVGGCWDTTNHRFTAQVTGYYEITYSILNAAGAAFWVEIKKNGTAITTGQYPRGYTGTQYTPATATGILSLSANDYLEFWVGTGTAHNFHCFASGKLIS